MPKARKYVHLKSPEGDRVIVAAGEEVPDWADLPDSVLEKEEPKPAPRKRAARKKAAPTTLTEIEEAKVPIPEGE